MLLSSPVTRFGRYWHVIALMNHVMIYEAVYCLVEEINEYLKGKLKVGEDKIILSGIVNQDGTVAVQGENKILVTLINIEKENVGKSNGYPIGSRTTPNTAAALTINLYVLFSAYFNNSNYAESLRFLSFIVSYFQKKHVFTRSNTPRLSTDIDKLILEMETLSAEKLNNVWATLGAKYMPSVLYKIRMLRYDDAVVHEFRPEVQGTDQEHGVQ
jgi:hypothetical protein